MNRHKEKKRNFIILVSFAAIFSLILMVGLVQDESTEIVSAAEFESTTIDLHAFEVAANRAAGFDVEDSSDNAELMAALGEFSEDEQSSEGDAEEMALIDEMDVSSSEGDLAAAYNVTEYEYPVSMYSSDTVNVRCGAGTEYQKVGKVAWGTQVEVLGVTDNGWYEVSFNDQKAFIRGDYIVAEMPGIPYLFVGDSRTVQLQMAVGSTDKAYIAKVGEGYNYFRDVALPAIPKYAGQGTTMIINFGVNDLSNAKKYVKLVNSNIEAWTNAGITVYYSAVTPVGAGATVSNAQIEAFNATLQEGLDERVKWIDSYTYLLQTGFSSSDGLHYSKDTYRNLYSYYVGVVNQQGQ
ncbi:MAG: SH3 domain-containing protein [Butyrivibrio sp.]|nr:SH3 domain-containing protein [Butyrivibrio sp.]